MHAPTTPLDEVVLLRQQLTAELRAATASPPPLDLDRRTRLAAWLRTQGEALRERAHHRRAVLAAPAAVIGHLARRTLARLHEEGLPVTAQMAPLAVLHEALCEAALVAAASQVLDRVEGR
jgi:hypothetical protein